MFYEAFAPFVVCEVLFPNMVGGSFAPYASSFIRLVMDLFNLLMYLIQFCASKNTKLLSLEVHFGRVLILLIVIYSE